MVESRWWAGVLCRGHFACVAWVAGAAGATLALVLAWFILRPGWGCGCHVHDMLLELLHLLLDLLVLYGHVGQLLVEVTVG